MSDLQRTFTYVAVAVLAAVVAWEPWRGADRSNAPIEDTKTLFPKFTDPFAANSLEITKYDEETASLHPFKVTQINNIWSIPSHQSYPADAKDHMAKAATALIDLAPLGVASDLPGDQELYGVIDPDPKTLKAGTIGVGTRITLRDAKDDVLADLIVGKEVKDQPQQRYVRKAGTDRIYRVALKTDSMSTKFEDWIEKDLLKLNAFDVREIELNDYSSDAALTQQGVAVSKTPRSKIKLAFDDQKSAWSVVNFTDYDKAGKPSAGALADDEELNSEKLNALKTALADLKIVDVERKPKGLSADLKATKEFDKDEEGIGSLVNRGFYPVPVSSDHVELYSGEGEVIVGLKDGVEYVLRFGNATGGSAGKDDAKKEDGKKEDAKKADPQMNRYMFVMAQLNKKLIPEPQLEPLPGEGQAEGEKKSDAQDKAEDVKAEDVKAQADKSPAAEKKSAADQKAAPDKKAPPAKKGARKPDPDIKKMSDQPADANAAGTNKPADASKPGEAAADQAPADKPADEKAAADKAADKPAAGKASDEEAQGEKARLADQKRAAIENQNKRKQQEYDDKVKKAEERVNELNERFADWYFVISDDVYHKIHLSRADVVKAKTKPAGEGEGVDALKALEGGLKK